MLTLCKRRGASGKILLLSAPPPDVGHIPRVDVSDQIRSARIKLGLTQRQLAKAVGVTAGAVGQWEGGGGRSGISTDNLVAVARVLQLPVSGLVGDGRDGLTTTDPTEIAWVELYRRLSPALREIHLRLLYEQVGCDAPQKKGGPTDRVTVTAIRPGKKSAYPT